ncbi:hypothetical protein AAFF_G00146750 [Aldrovandia affinis]|uniref:Uncharacterized protein n=1 Tax=Aldrovandia affinis TaxID=143900 RepID=A0AAD7RQ15_9TELE|nr:hypothetical protein AAFF_G00146750 [Aldrovandia affinis]
MHGNYKFDARRYGRGSNGSALNEKKRSFVERRRYEDDGGIQNSVLRTSRLPLGRGTGPGLLLGFKALSELGIQWGGGVAMVAFLVPKSGWRSLPGQEGVPSDSATATSAAESSQASSRPTAVDLQRAGIPAKWSAVV